MRHRGGWTRSILTAVTAVLALCGATTATAAPDTQAAPAAPGAPRRQAVHQDNWPKKIPLGDATLPLDAPQADRLEGTKLTARGTGRFERADGNTSYGTIWYEAEVEIDRDRRTVTLVSVEVPKMQFDGVPQARQQRLSTTREPGPGAFMPAMRPLPDGAMASAGDRPGPDSATASDSAGEPGGAAPGPSSGRPGATSTSRAMST